MKIKKLFALVWGVLFSSIGAWAQTDVTDTYLTNADFSGTTALDNGLCGYGKDMSGKGTTYYGLQAIDGWTSAVVSGDNTNATYPNSGMGGAVFAYGSDQLMMGNNTKAPSADPDGNSGNCLGFFAVWGCGGYYYQEVTLAAGRYTINIPVYSQSGTQANTSYIGWIPDSGTSYTLATNPTVGSWTTLTTTFTLTDVTTGKICLGYKSTGSGSGANAMLYFDKVQILYTEIVVKDVLETALTAATNANATLSDSDLATAITTAQAVYDDENATQSEVNSAAATLNAATELAMSAAGDVTGIFLSNPGFESCTVTTTNAAAGGSAAPVNIEGGWTQTNSAAWSSSAVVAYGGSGQVNGASAPSADNAGNSGNTLGVSVGWGGVVTYQSAAITLPAGVYAIKVNAYNGFAGAQQFASKFGFVPTVGASTLSTKKSFASNTWETDQVTVTLNEATEGVIQVGGQGVSGGSGSNAKVFFDNITITYTSFLVAAKEAWDEAVAAAEQAKIDCPNVTGEELTALNAELAKAEPATVADYNEATEDLETATAALIASAASYDALVTVNGLITVAGTLEYADAEKKPSADVTATSASDADTKTASQYTALRAYYESNALAEGIDGAVDCAEAIAGAAPDTNTGWTGGIGTDNRSWEQYTDASGNPGGRYYDGGWSTSAAVNINMSRSISLPAGTYLLTVTARASENLTSYTMSVADSEVDLPTNGSGENQGVFGHGWDDVSVEFVSDGHPVTLTIAATSTEYQQWISFNRFRLIRLSLNTSAYATSTEYDALNSAISTAEAKTLGFEDEQYAPYNNIAALEALDAAKAIDQDAELTNLKTDVQALTTALTGATWTANDGDVDAIFNGHFAEANGYNPKGWTRSNSAWGSQITGLEASTGAETSTAWYYNTEGAWEYGKDGFYTMPLAASTAYRLTFKYRSHAWGSNNWLKVSVLNGDEEGMADVTFPQNADATNFVTATATFTTGAAGNYVLSLHQSGNTHLTDVSLVKVASATGELADGNAYTPALNYYEALTMTRTIKAGYNTVVLPFDLSEEQVAEVFGDESRVYEFTEGESADADHVVINFTEKGEASIAANVPVLVKATEGSSSKTINGVLTSNAGLQNVETTNCVFTGNYGGNITLDEGTYFITNDGATATLYKSTGLSHMKSFRAYIAPKSGDAEVKLFIDDEDMTTAIEGLENDVETGSEAIYTLSGQRVSKATKGIFIKDGKKVLVK